MASFAWDNAVGDLTWRDGAPLPSVLAGRFASEPKWVDLRGYRDGADKRDAKFTELRTRSPMGSTSAECDLPEVPAANLLSRTERLAEAR
jgi:hypothetical protein